MFTQCLNTLSTIVSSTGKYCIQFRSRSGPAKSRVSTIVLSTGKYYIQFRTRSGPAKSRMSTIVSSTGNFCIQYSLDPDQAQQNYMTKEGPQTRLAIDRSICILTRPVVITGFNRSLLVDWWSIGRLKKHDWCEDT